MSTAFRAILVLAIVGLGALLVTQSSRRLYSFAPTTSQSTTREGATASAKAATAAGAFLGTLDAKLKSKAQLELRTDLRARWSNLPTGVAMQADRGRSGGPFERNGVSLGELTRAQQDAALAVVAAALSGAGYQKVLDIVAADQVLEESVGPTRPPQNRVRFGR